MILISGVESSLSAAFERSLSRLGETSLISPSRDFHSIIAETLRGRDGILVMIPPSFDIDYYEMHREEAYAGISIAVKKAAETASLNDIPLYFISSVHVFSGRVEVPCREDTAPEPVSVFGDACLLAERYLAESPCRSCIIRTGELLGEGDWDLSPCLAGENRGRQVTVPAGVITPAAPEGLAEYAAVLIERGATGLYHYSLEGEATRCEVMQYLFREMETEGLLESIPGLVEKELREIPLGAERLVNSVLEGSKLEEEPGAGTVSWQAGVREYVRGLKK